MSDKRTGMKKKKIRPAVTEAPAPSEQAQVSVPIPKKKKHQTRN